MRFKFDALFPVFPGEDRTGLSEVDPDVLGRAAAGDPLAIAAVNAHADAIGVLAESELILADALLAESERALNYATQSLTPAGLPGSMGFDPGRFRMADNITINVNAGVIGNEDTVDLAVHRSILSLERKGDPLRYTGGL